MPTGEPLPDGYAARITHADFPDVEFFIKEVTPFGLEGGGPNPQTTMENVKYRTQKPKKLLTVTSGAITVAYQTAVLTRMTLTDGGCLLKNGLMSVEYADLSKHNFWGWYESFKPNALQEGQQPTAVVGIEVSNINDSGVETGPVYVAPPGP